MKGIFASSLIFLGLTVSAQTTMNIYQSNGTVLVIPLSSIDSITYTVNIQGNLATLSTLPLSDITGTAAVCGGNITDDGGTSVIQRGVCWSATPMPTTANNLSSDGSGVGNYTSTLNDLQPEVTYYVRAYATNGAGTAYGNQMQFQTTTEGGGILNPDLTYGSVSDQSGNTYMTIVIGTQEWMAENLRSSTYANGDPIPNVTDYISWGDLSTGAWSHYANESQYELPYGKLYNWYAVADTRNVCPTGWHVPTDAEWMILTDYLGGWAGAGGKMKSTSSEYWSSPNTGATNESGFSGLPGGYRNPDVFYFANIGGYGVWWSASESASDMAWVLYLNNNNSGIVWSYDIKRNGSSVRCIRD